MKTMEMELQKVHLIRLEKDEELLTSILEYVKKKNILAGYLTGIGALGKGKIGYFDIKSKKYLHIPFKEVELLACTGNIAKNKDTQEPVAHIHVLIGEKDGKSLGGHLVEGIVSVTAEIYLVETKPGVFRTKDEENGLYLLNPKN
ncbi:MAG: DNA-binding protein [Candidatus Heimdallarchaeota archaeon]|nr:DNA-binding protein [Candidatus Heimdallarchaeota archaeon]MCK5184134.1 DNA-binding protein [Candidatus Heimdallarchaeota archaeon]MCK5298981.1 DNA-binding protein [Candidatus Heimdallarchaeota archaeon]